LAKANSNPVMAPATPGQVKSSGGQHSMPAGQLEAHLAQHVEDANTTKDYGGHGIGCSSEGGFQQGGAGGAEYETTSVGDTPDADSAGPTGY
jgi:hypothetical protein